MSLSVIIPSRNAANLVPCLRAIAAFDPGHRVIVVDDGLDRSALEWEQRLPELQIIPGVKPFVFARNVNLGIKAACDQIDVTTYSDSIPVFAPGRPNDVIILNDDALLETPGGFSLLQRQAQLHPEFGIIAATCNNVGNRNQWRHGIGLREEPRMVCFVAVLVPGRTIEAVGLLDERYTGYGCDDDDYSFSVRKAGLRIGIHDGCYVDHGSLTSSYRGPAGAGGNFLPNLALFIQKWGADNWGRPRSTSQFAHLFPDEVSANAL